MNFNHQDLEACDSPQHVFFMLDAVSIKVLSHLSEIFRLTFPTPPEIAVPFSSLLEWLFRHRLSQHNPNNQGHS